MEDVMQAETRTGHELWRCPECDWRYDEAQGDAAEGFPAGTPLGAFPDAWSCPDCGVRAKGDFERAVERP
jgi:rubredoxin